MAALIQLADAYETLLTLAFDGLIQSPGLRVDDVQLKEGTPDPRWIVKDYDKASGTVLVTTTSGRPGRERSLTEVHPDTLLAWARTQADPLPPLVRAVADMAALPGEEPQDLRRLVERLRGSSTRCETRPTRARWPSRCRTASNGWPASNGAARTTHASTSRRRGTCSTSSGSPTSARWHLMRLLSSLSSLKFTDYFEKFESEIVAYREQVEKEIANLRLAESFPGTRIGLDGEMSWIHFDFENPIQLQVFKEGPGHATGRIEKYVNNAKPVTPTRADHRFVLNWGMKELVRSRPMELPCIFDPAERITLEFTLHTLGSPFFFAVDIDGLQARGPLRRPHVGRLRRTLEVPGGHAAPRRRVGTSPRGLLRSRARCGIPQGRGFGDPSSWAWPSDGHGRFWERWFGSRRLASDLFAFEPQESYRLKIVRDQGSLTLFVNDTEIMRKERSASGPASGSTATGTARSAAPGRDSSRCSRGRPRPSTTCGSRATCWSDTVPTDHPERSR